MLAVHDLHKAFGSHTVLHGIQFTAAKGDVIALLGSSGSGKSTLLRCLNLLEIPDQGQLAVDEQTFNFDQQSLPRPAQIKYLRQRVGMVFQQFNLWSHMTILDNLIEAPIHVSKRPRAQVITEAKALLTKVGIDDKQQAYPRQLSGGQQQRAAIARALMMRPQIMLFDEPTSALDPEMVGEVLAVMRTLAQQEKVTLLVATHELHFAREVATHIMFLEQGKIIEFGHTEQVINQPKTLRFKQFLTSGHVHD